MDYDESDQQMVDYEMTENRNEFEAEQEYMEPEFDTGDGDMDDARDLGSAVPAPEHPPKEPLSAFQLFMEDHKHDTKTHTELKRSWKEDLGKSEIQRYKRQAKEDAERFDELLAAYEAAHPDFDSNAYYDNQPKPTKQTKKAAASGTAVAPSRGRKRSNQEYLMNDYSADDHRPSSKKQRRGVNRRDPDSKTERVFKELRANAFGGRKRKKADGDACGADQTNELKAFLDRMRDVARDDRAAKASGDPALGCMRELDRFVAECSKKQLQVTLLEHCNLLDALRDWLAPFPDGSLPHLKIRTELYRLIESLRLHQRYEELKGYFGYSADHGKDEGKDGFAKTMMKLWRHPDETPQNKNKLQMLIQSWVRVLSQTAINYNEVFEHAEMNKKQIQRRNEIIRKAQKARRTLYENPNVKRKRARVPQAVGFDFAIAPRSQVTEADMEETTPRRSNEGQGIDRRTARNMMLNKSLQKRPKGARLNGPSLTGRG